MENNRKKIRKIALYIASIALWILLWYVAAEQINNDIFLPSPKKVINILFSELIYSETFRLSLFNSVVHIGQGFAIGTVLGVLLAVLASFNEYIDIFVWLPIKVIKTVPVASFVILVLLWCDSDSLAVIIPAMVVLPTLFINTKEGIKQTNNKLLDMARVYNVPNYKRIIYIYVPNCISYVLSACSLATGMAWKAGIAAEIIGLAKNSIGNELYKAKLYLMIPELFAWTIVIVVLSIICELVIKYLISLVGKRD